MLDYVGVRGKELGVGQYLFEANKSLHYFKPLVQEQDEDKVSLMFDSCYRRQINIRQC